MVKFLFIVGYMLLGAFGILYGDYFRENYLMDADLSDDDYDDDFDCDFD